MTRSYTDPTLVRTRGQVIIEAVAGIVRGAVGIIAWDDIDDTIPTVAERPTPFSNPDLDWIWHSYYFTPAGGALVYRASIGGAGSDIDSRAMRRLGNRKGIAIVIEAGTSAVSVQFDFGIRCLLKE